jgi:hypothetical protein
VRAHQAVKAGYEWAFPQLVTLFSAPNYLYECMNCGAGLDVGDNLSFSFIILDPIPLPPPAPKTLITTVPPRPDKRHRSPQLLTRDDRFADKSFHALGPAAYTLARDMTLNGQKGKIRPKPTNKLEDWDNIPQRDSPDPGHYEIRPLAKACAGYISTIGHGRFAPEQPDRPLAFRTKHGSLIRKLHNARYSNVATE